MAEGAPLRLAYHNASRAGSVDLRRCMRGGVRPRSPHSGPARAKLAIGLSSGQLGQHGANSDGVRPPSGRIQANIGIGQATAPYPSSSEQSPYGSHQVWDGFCKTWHGFEQSWAR